MRATCPSCTTAYEVPDTVAAPGRRMRCARCGTAWAPLPAAPARETRPPPATPALRALLDSPAPPSPPRNRRRTLLAGAWAGSFAVLLLAGWLAVSARQQVMRAWPPSTRLYTALGLPPR